ncbi:hypothetical protein [uncultured Robinsoniella sp.]|uniref:hypothetical protein n=1 Tax=uncultured Robinsoniella sp. TaxID=904190 RepID=UPI00374F81B9
MGEMMIETLQEHFKNANDYGFSPQASGVDNQKALQAAAKGGGTVLVSIPGTYKIAGTVYLESFTTLIFGNGVLLQKSGEAGMFSHVFLNRGALTKTYDTCIRIHNLYLSVNGIDIRKFEVEGLHGQLAFFYVKDLNITGFRCMDLGKWQYAIQICTFEDILVQDMIIRGDKDGVHLGRGKRFCIRDGIFDTYDDAIALNGHDYDVGNPELGWIEDGIIEKCQDLTHDGKTTDGYFCRMLAGGWVDWFPGIRLQKSDTVAAGGRLYRVKADPDGKEYISTVCPSHEQGIEEIEGIQWFVVQDEVTYTAGVRNVTFRDISLQKPRTGFSIHFDNDRYSRSYYPGAQIPYQEKILFDSIRVVHKKKIHLMEIGTPVDLVHMTNCVIGNSTICFHGNHALEDYGNTKANICNCIFNNFKKENLIENNLEKKEIRIQFSGNIEM